MNWVQENKSLAGILGVMIAGILGLGAWMYLSFADYSASMEKWQQNDNSISALKSKNCNVFAKVRNGTQIVFRGRCAQCVAAEGAQDPGPAPVAATSGP